MHGFPKKISRVDRITTNYKVTWLLEKACNYDCKYCVDHHEKMTKDTRFKTLEELKHYWGLIHSNISMNGRKIDISFSGGEVTLNKDFIPFLEWLNDTFDDIDSIIVTSNGSASKKYYMELVSHITNLTLSTHVEYFNEKKFFNTIAHLFSNLKDTVFFIQLMNEDYYPNNRIHLYKKYFEKNNIPYSLMDIDFPPNPFKTRINTNKELYEF
jgi:organic radical activating enzyme